MPKDLNLPKENTNTKQVYANIDEEITSLEELERLHILRILKENNWNRENSARALGISQKTLYSKIKNYKLQ